MTAAQLHAALSAKGCHLRIDAGELVITPPPPPELERYFPALLTGVWAVTAGRRWYGNHRDTGHACGPCPLAHTGPLAYGALDPDKLLPRAVGFLSVGGEEGSMDRIPAEWLTELPEVFELMPATRPARTPNVFAPTPTFDSQTAG